MPQKYKTWLNMVHHVILLTLAQAPLSVCPGLLPLLTLITILGKAALQQAGNCFNSNRVGPELVPCIKTAKIGPLFRKKAVLPCLLNYVNTS